MGLPVTNPDAVIFGVEITARALLLKAVAANLPLLTQAITTKPDQTFELNVTISLDWQRDDILRVLREHGYEINYPNQGESA